MIKKIWHKWIDDWNWKTGWYHNIIFFPRNFYKFCKEICFLLKNGYPYEALYNMDGYFVELFSKILKDCKENHWGYPGGEEIGGRTNEEWEDTLQQMIDYLSKMDIFKMECKYTEDYEKPWDKELYCQFYDELEDNKDKFFELFGKWFYHLWD